MNLVDVLRQRASDPADQRDLQREGFFVDRFPDPVFWRERGDPGYRRFGRDDLERLLARFRKAGNEARLA